MQVTLEGICRGDRCVYVILKKDGEEAPLVQVSRRGQRVPFATLPIDLIGKTVDGRPATGLWVVAIPRLAVDMVVEVLDGAGDVARTIPLKQLSSKISSRMLAAKRPELADAVRTIEEGNWSGRTRVTLRDVWPSDEGQVVWRVVVEYPTDDGVSEPALLVTDSVGQEVPATVRIMEDQMIPSARDMRLPMRVVTFSLTVAQGLAEACLVARLGEQGLEGFLFVPSYRLAEQVGRGRYLVKGAAVDGAYERWFDLHRATKADLARQRAYAERLGTDIPLLSLVLPVPSTSVNHARETIASLMRQSWRAWQLVVVTMGSRSGAAGSALVKQGDDGRIVTISSDTGGVGAAVAAGLVRASGDYIGFIDCGDVLEPDALWRYAEAAMSNSDADLIYCDEDTLKDGRPTAPLLKPDPQYGLLYAYNYISHMLMVSRDALDAMGDFELEADSPWSYVLTLRAFEVARDVVHIPHILYHQRSSDVGASEAVSDAQGYAGAAHGRRALKAHLARRGIEAEVADGRAPGTYRVIYSLPQPEPRASIIIPTKDHVELLKTCVESILAKTAYPDYEIVLVENNSTKDETFTYYRQVVDADPRVKVVTWTPAEGHGDAIDSGFNYSSICNVGARAASGDIFVFLNNDTDVIDGDWLTELARQLQRPEVGIAGAKLLFQDGLVQHCGVAATPAGDNCHVNQNLTESNEGYALSACCPMEWSMVTGACLAVAKETFERLGGYDEGLAVGFNDTDLCLTARELGLSCVCTPYALLHHREFSSRGREEGNPKKQARLLQEKAYVMGKHPQFYASHDPVIDEGINQWTGHWELAW